MPEYRFDLASGRWRHKDGAVEPPLRLTQLSYVDGRLDYPHRDDRAPGRLLQRYSTRRTCSWTRSRAGDDVDAAQVSADFEHLRWFELPRVCLT